MASPVDLQCLENLIENHLPADTATVERLHQNFPEHTVKSYCRNLLLKYEPLCLHIETEETRCREAFYELEPYLHPNHEDDVHMEPYAKASCDYAIRYVNMVAEYKKRLAQLGLVALRASA